MRAATRARKLPGTTLSAAALVEVADAAGCVCVATVVLLDEPNKTWLVVLADADVEVTIAVWFSNRICGATEK
jgi:hypothetical protein